MLVENGSAGWYCWAASAARPLLRTFPSLRSTVSQFQVQSSRDLWHTLARLGRVYHIDQLGPGLAVRLTVDDRDDASLQLLVALFFPQWRHLHRQNPTRLRS